VFSGGAATYTVVFDAGSTGNRVHVFKFTESAKGPQLQNEVFHAMKPGFRDVAADAQQAADLLDPLLVTALNTVPPDQRKSTKLTLRATAGLRLLPEGPDAAQAIMDAVKVKLQATEFKVPDEYITVLDGSDEGAYGWIAVNYLLGKMGRVAEETAAVVDLGRGLQSSTFRLIVSTFEGYAVCFHGVSVTKRLRLS
jgi:apyrase